MAWPSPGIGLWCPWLGYLVNTARSRWEFSTREEARKAEAQVPLDADVFGRLTAFEQWIWDPGTPSTPQMLRVHAHCGAKRSICWLLECDGLEFEPARWLQLDDAM